MLGDLYVLLSPERLSGPLEPLAYEPSHDAVHDLWQACEDVLAMHVVRTATCTAPFPPATFAGCTSSMHGTLSKRGPGSTSHDFTVCRQNGHPICCAQMMHILLERLVNMLCATNRTRLPNPNTRPPSPQPRSPAVHTHIFMFLTLPITHPACMHQITARCRCCSGQRWGWCGAGSGAAAAGGGGSGGRPTGRVRRRHHLTPRACRPAAVTCRGARARCGSCHQGSLQVSCRL